MPSSTSTKPACVPMSTPPASTRVNTSPTSTVKTSTWVYPHCPARTKTAHHIIEERCARAISSLKDFVNRVDIGREQLEILIRIGAFRFTGMNKYQLMWEKMPSTVPPSRCNTAPSFGCRNRKTLSCPHGRRPVRTSLRRILNSSASPLLTLRSYGCQHQSRHLRRRYEKHMGRIVTMIGYYVTRKDVTTSNRKLMNFGTWIDEKATSLTPPTSHPPLPATLQRPRPLPASKAKS